MKIEKIEKFLIIIAMLLLISGIAISLIRASIDSKLLTIIDLSLFISNIVILIVLLLIEFEKYYKTLKK